MWCFASADTGSSGSTRDFSGGTVGSVVCVSTPQSPREKGSVRQTPNRHVEWVNTQQVLKPETQIWLSLSHWYPGSGVVLNCIDS